jgi:hypothetical protein
MKGKYRASVVVLLSVFYLSGCAPVKGSDNSGKTYQPLAPEYARTSG